MDARAIFLENVPSDLGRYYPSGYHPVPSAAELDRAAARESYKLDLLRPYASQGRIIDIGSSYGGFPHLARRAGYDVTAIELDPDCCDFIERVIGARAIQSAAPQDALQSLPEADIITMWHSIEHLSQPWQTVEAAAERLRPNGVLAVATPNPVGLQARLTKGRWAHVDAPRHLFLMPPVALRRRAEKTGLTPLLTTSSDVETRRCNWLGWRRALMEVGLRFPGVWGLGSVLAMLMAPLELGGERASAYVTLWGKPPQ